MTDAEKVKTIAQYFNQATDKDNPARIAQDLDEVMFGRIPTEVQSYDLLDNRKYKDLASMLQLISENFGYNEDTEMQKMVKHHSTPGVIPITEGKPEKSERMDRSERFDKSERFKSERMDPLESPGVRGERVHDEFPEEPRNPFDPFKPTREVRRTLLFNRTLNSGDDNQFASNDHLAGDHK